jgi:hypothetical protein
MLRPFKIDSTNLGKEFEYTSLAVGIRKVRACDPENNKAARNKA